MDGGGFLRQAAVDREKLRRRRRWASSQAAVGGVNLDSFGFPLDPTDPLEAVPIGSIDPVSGMKVAAIVAFSGTLAQSLMRPDNLATAFLSQGFSTDRDRLRTSTTSVFTLGSPFFTGLKDSNDGQAFASMADIMTMAGGALNLKFRNATAGEIPHLGDRSNASGPTWTDRRAIGAHPYLPGFLFRGKCRVQIRNKVTPSGFTIPQTSVVSTDGGSGRNPSAASWCLDFLGGSEAQGDGGIGGETDFSEVPSDHKANFRASGISGGQGGTIGISDGTMHIIECFFSTDADPTKAAIRRLNDAFVLQGSAYTQNYDATGTGNLAKFWEMMFGIFANTQTPFTAPYDDAAMAGKSNAMQVTSLRYLVPTDRKTVVPIIAPMTVVVAQSETGAKQISLPSAAAIWGPGAWTESLRWYHPIDVNAPGRADEFTASRSTSSGLPAGLAQDLNARTVDLTLGTFKRPGAVHGEIAAADSLTGACRTYRVVIRVAPSLNIPQPASGAGAVVGSPFSYVIPRDDGAGNRYWDCGNLAFGAPGLGGLEVVSLPPGWTWTPGTRTISSGGNNVVSGQTTVGFRMTNGAGDVTAQSVDFLDTGWTPASISSGQRVWVQDPKDTTTVPGANGAAVGTITDRYTAGRTIGSPGGSEPTINTAGGPAGAHRTLAYNGSQYSWAFAGANNSGLVDLFDTSNFTTGSGYFAFYGKTDNTGIERFVQWCNSSGGTTFGYRHGASDRGIGYNVGAPRTVVQASQDQSWHAVELVKNGSSLTLTIDGTDVATGTITDTGALDAIHFVVGANRSASVNTADLTGQMYRQLGLNTLPDSTTRGNIRTWLAAA